MIMIYDNDLCIFCNGNKDSNILWECNIVQTFWNRFVQWLLWSCKHIFNIQLSLELVIFGCSNVFKTDPIVDLLLLLAKHYIERAKVQNVHPNIAHFINEAKHRYVIENHIYLSRNSINVFLTKWSVYHQLFQNL